MNYDDIRRKFLEAFGHPDPPKMFVDIETEPGFMSMDFGKTEARVAAHSDIADALRYSMSATNASAQSQKNQADMYSAAAAQANAQANAHQTALHNASRQMGKPLSLALGYGGSATGRFSAGAGGHNIPGSLGSIPMPGWQPAGEEAPKPLRITDTWYPIESAPESEWLEVIGTYKVGVTPDGLGGRVVTWMGYAKRGLAPAPSGKANEWYESAWFASSGHMLEGVTLSHWRMRGDLPEGMTLGDA